MASEVQLYHRHYNKPPTAVDKLFLLCVNLPSAQLNAMKRWFVVVKVRVHCPHRFCVVVLLEKVRYGNFFCVVAGLWQKCNVAAVLLIP